MKWLLTVRKRRKIKSLPVRGAWIEIFSIAVETFFCCMSLPVRGAWIEIFRNFAVSRDAPRRSPCGERGLK